VAVGLANSAPASNIRIIRVRIVCFSLFT